MKKLLYTLLGLALIPGIALATPSSVDRVTDHIEPLIKGDFIRGAYFVGTTTATSTLVGAIKAPCFTVTGLSCLTSGGGSSATTTINGVNGPTFTFLSSSTALTYSTSTGTITINLSTSTLQQLLSGTSSQLWSTNGSGIFNTNQTGNVGIGTTTPVQKLDVNGNINIPTSSSTAGAIYQNNTRYIHSFGLANNFIGTNAGNFTLTGQSNSGIGYQALNNLTSGNYNNAFGTNALLTITTGQSNVAFGNSAGALLNGGDSNNVMIGDSSMISDTGSGNTTIGANSARSLTGSAVSTNNTFIGNGSMFGGVGGLSNATAIGYNSFVGISNALVLGGTGGSAVNVGIGTTTPPERLYVNGNIGLPLTTSIVGQIVQNGVNVYSTYGTRNVFLGSPDGQAGNFTLNTSSASDNVGVGRLTLRNLTTGSNNLAIGSNALLQTTSGTGNMALGASALQQNIDGSDNVAVGQIALANAQNANYNVGVGTGALYFTSGGSNVGIGRTAGVNNTTGTQNIWIGTNSGINSLQGTGLTNAIAIGYDTYTTVSNQVRLGSTSISTTLLNGLVGIGTTTPFKALTTIGEMYSTATVTAPCFATSIGGTCITSSGANYGDSLTPTGTVNGSNTAFTLANAPSPAASLQLFVNGQLMTNGGIDYTLAGTGITFVVAPPTGSIIRAWYRY